jgi:hypothetical protein
MTDKPLTIIHMVVEPNGPGGIDGEPIPVGVAMITRIRPGEPAVVRHFDPPRADLLSASEEEIAAAVDSQSV